MKKGYYVRCPIDFEEKRNREFILGQVINVDEYNDEIEVVFHDIRNLRDFFISLPKKNIYKSKKIRRSEIMLNSTAIFEKKIGKIINIAEKPSSENLFYYYYFAFENSNEIIKVCETNIIVGLENQNINPVIQLLSYELQNPRWYFSRRIVSKSSDIINNSPTGFAELLSTRVFLYNHQVDTVVRAISEKKCRFMLADEVGLGKTIEALTIIKTMNERKKLNTLIIVPKALIYQWKTELNYKYWIEAPIWNVDIYREQSYLLVSYEDLNKDYDSIIHSNDWDFIIVDETHRLLKNFSLYTKVLELSKKAENLLLLSATPIIRRKDEYFNLLKLLNPTRFENMSAERFNNIIERQIEIRDIVYNIMQDLQDFEDDEELREEIIEDLYKLNESICDNKIENILSNIDENSEDKGLKQVKICLSYISEFYQIERKIIRHRRQEIEASDNERKLEYIEYEISGSDYGSYDEKCYQLVTDFAEDLLRTENNESIIEFVKEMLFSLSSSPFALISVIEKNKNSIDIPEVLFKNAIAWQNEVNEEIKGIMNVTDEIDNFFSRYAKLIDYIEQEYDFENNKFIIFTGFKETAIKLTEAFKNFFGTNRVSSFYSGMDSLELQNSADNFQNNRNVKFMICDESGGEGRNFQVADYIIHFDLPWSPHAIEQRIGRLDRIGREKGKPVVSVVIYSVDTINNSIYNVFNESLNIFRQSLCGLEIAFDEITSTIEKALVSDIRHGLETIKDQVTRFTNDILNEVDRERYFDKAREIDIDTKDRIEDLIGEFTGNNGERLQNTMMEWLTLVGYKGISYQTPYNDETKVISINTLYENFSIASMKNSLYFPPTGLDDIVNRSKMKNDIIGTFSRKDAINHENLTFYAPKNPLFDSIVDNAKQCYRGRSTAVKMYDTDYNWHGFVFTWNIKFNLSLLIEKEIDISLSSVISKFIYNPQIMSIEPYVDETNELMQLDNPTVDDIQHLLNNYSKYKRKHLGERGNNGIDEFLKNYPAENWKANTIDAYKKCLKEAKESVKNSINFKKVNEELTDILSTMKARSIYYGYNDESSTVSSEREIEVLIEVLKKPIIELDSVCFLVLT